MVRGGGLGVVLVYHLFKCSKMVNCTSLKYLDYQFGTDGTRESNVVEFMFFCFV